MFELMFEKEFSQVLISHAAGLFQSIKSLLELKSRVHAQRIFLGSIWEKVKGRLDVDLGIKGPI